MNVAHELRLAVIRLWYVNLQLALQFGMRHIFLGFVIYAQLVRQFQTGHSSSLANGRRGSAAQESDMPI
jgi:hypothetical protein